MFLVALIGFTLALLAVVIAAVVMFFDVAFAAEGARAKSRLHLPLLKGEALKQWAATLAERIVSRHVERPRTVENTLSLAREVEAQTSQVLDQSLVRVVLRRTKCADCSREPIVVTAPEALAIVDELGKKLTSGEVRQIASLAHENAEKLAQANDGQTIAQSLVCPLLASDGGCASYATRPVYCRSHCPECGPAGFGAADQEFARTLGHGVTSGLTAGLSNAGWDGGLYELNFALDRALNVPDAAGRWAHGEPLFADSCATNS